MFQLLAKLFDPATVPGAVLLGIIAGTVSSVVMIALGQMLTKIVMPWYESVVYKGVHLEGLWLSKVPTSQLITYDYQMTLKQRAHRISGSMTITKSGAPKGPYGDYVQAFDVTGTTWEGFVTLNMQSADKRSVAFATSLLQIDDRGRGLVGQLAYRSSRGGLPESEAIEWLRAEN